MKVLVLCPKCEGSGRVRVKLLSKEITRNCPRCKGKKKVKGEFHL